MECLPEATDSRWQKITSMLNFGGRRETEGATGEAQRKYNDAIITLISHHAIRKQMLIVLAVMLRGECEEIFFLLSHIVGHSTTKISSVTAAATAQRVCLQCV